MQKGLGVIAALVLGLYAIYLYQFPTYTVRYRLTVDVDVDGKLVSGSSVREVRFWRQVIVFSAPYSFSLDGEAVVVDLGKRGILFATTNGNDNSFSTDEAKLMPERVFRQALKLPQNFDRSKGGDSRVELWRQLSQIRHCTDVIRDEWPMLVRFGDLKVPASVERVDPSNLAASFGPGVSLRAITICIVDEPASRIVEQFLPWIINYNGPMANWHGGPISVDQAPFNIKVENTAFKARPRK